jgi:hypothetical protein
MYIGLFARNDYLNRLKTAETKQKSVAIMPENLNVLKFL